MLLSKQGPAFGRQAPGFRVDTVIGEHRAMMTLAARVLPGCKRIRIYLVLEHCISVVLPERGSASYCYAAVQNKSTGPGTRIGSVLTSSYLSKNAARHGCTSWTLGKCRYVQQTAIRQSSTTNLLTSARRLCLVSDSTAHTSGTLRIPALAGVLPASHSHTYAASEQQQVLHTKNMTPVQRGDRQLPPRCLYRHMDFDCVWPWSHD
jgi:hypothetical protein